MDTVISVINILKSKNFRISFAESCTGGLAAARLIDIPDVSSVFDASFVTYANSAKIKLIGVRETDINTYGVVSEEVARGMAEGCAKEAGADVGVGISGIAGPTGETAKKPIGMVCFGFYIAGECFSYTMQFGNIGRNNVREKSVEFVYTTLSKLLKGEEV